MWDGITGFFNNPVGTGQAIQEDMRAIANAGEQGHLRPAGELLGGQAGAFVVGGTTGIVGGKLVQLVNGKWVEIGKVNKPFSPIAGAAADSEAGTSITPHPVKASYFTSETVSSA